MVAGRLAATQKRPQSIPPKGLVFPQTPGRSRKTRPRLSGAGVRSVKRLLSLGNKNSTRGIWGDNTGRRGNFEEYWVRVLVSCGQKRGRYRGSKAVDNGQALPQPLK